MLEITAYVRFFQEGLLCWANASQRSEKQSQIGERESAERDD